MARTIYIDWESRVVYESEEELDSVVNAMVELGLENKWNMQFFLSSIGKLVKIFPSSTELIESIKEHEDEYRSWLYQVKRDELLEKCTEYVIRD